MKRIISLGLILLLIVTGLCSCSDKKQELQKKYDKVVTDITDTQKQIDQLQLLLDQQQSEMNTLNSQGTLNKQDSYAQDVLSQGEATRQQAQSQLFELQKQLEVDNLLKESLEKQLKDFK